MLLSKSWQCCMWAKACFSFPSLLLLPHAQLASLLSHPWRLAGTEQSSPAVLEVVILPQVITDKPSLGLSVSVWVGLQW